MKHTHRCFAGSIKLIAIQIGALILATAAVRGNAATTFNFTLDASYITSAGAYNASGQLVRTIWRRTPFAAGNHMGTWDDADDNGNPVKPGTYTIKVLFHNVHETWDGAIGNTSSTFVGEHVWRGFDPVYNLAISANNAFVAFGYNEGQTGLARFDTLSPQSVNYLGKPDAATVFQYVATDGLHVYYVNAGGGIADKSKEYSFTLAYNVADNSPFIFSAGAGVAVNNGHNWYPNCMDIDRDTADIESGVNQPTGIAVQQSGNILAIAHGPRNLIRLFDKTTGAPLQNLGISASYPQALAFAPNGDLWVVTGTSVQIAGTKSRPGMYITTGIGVERFAAATLGKTNEPSTTIRNLSQPLNISVNPVSSDVLVADGDASQQVKAFNPQGVLRWAYGQPGGYITNGPAVANDKFQFRNTVNWVGPYAALAAAPDGSFWVGDTGTCRLLHISSSLKYIDNVEYIPLTYNCAADPNRPDHVYGGDFLEFAVDYAKPLSPTNGSWRLVNNWAAGVPDTSKLFTGSQQGPNSVATLSNGRVYALMPTNTGYGPVIVELTATGIRPTPVGLPNYGSFAGDGSIRFDDLSSEKGFQTFYRLPVLGFDAAGNPQYPGPGPSGIPWFPYIQRGAFDPSKYALARVPAPLNSAGQWTPPVAGNGARDPNIPITSTNVVIAYDQSLNAGMHLGGAAVDPSGKSASWLWTAMPSVTKDTPPDGLGSYDIGDGVNYGGNLAMTAGRSIILGYNGEFWAQNQMSQWMYFYDDGLFVNQFGTDGWSRVPGASPGFAGNAYSPSLVSTAQGIYLWHNDESNHGGLVRWHLLGGDAIQEAVGSGALDSTISLSAPPPPFPTGLAATPGNRSVRLAWNAVRGAASYNVGYSKTDGGPYIVIRGVDATTYAVTGLPNNVDYYFVVTSVANGKESAGSNQVSARCKSLSVPPGPR